MFRCWGIKRLAALLFLGTAAVGSAQLPPEMLQQLALRPMVWSNQRGARKPPQAADVTVAENSSFYVEENRSALLIADLRRPDRVEQVLPLDFGERGFRAIAHAARIDRFFLLPTDRSLRGGIRIITFRLRREADGRFGLDSRSTGTIELPRGNGNPRSTSVWPWGLAVREDGLMLWTASVAAEKGGAPLLANYTVERGTYRIVDYRYPIRAESKNTTVVLMPPEFVGFIGHGIAWSPAGLYWTGSLQENRASDRSSNALLLLRSDTGSIFPILPPFARTATARGIADAPDSWLLLFSGRHPDEPCSVCVIPKLGVQ